MLAMFVTVRRTSKRRIDSRGFSRAKSAGKGAKLGCGIRLAGCSSFVGCFKKSPDEGPAWPLAAEGSKHTAGGGSSTWPGASLQLPTSL